MTNKKIASGSRHLINNLQDDQEQKLSYQTNKLSHYIQLQLSDLQNTLHYIQKKHSINQIKQSISHSYSIFSQTEPIFRQLRILFIYNKIKKLINCFSIVYLILMEHIQKPNKLNIQQKNKDSLNIQLQNQVQIKSILPKQKTPQVNIELKKPNKMGGINLFNQQYNRHVQSDLDRLKRKLKEEKKDQKESKISQKQKLKQQILKQINSDIYGSPSPDELTLFFNLNNNRFGSQLQYITFQDQLQQIATFFKESQDEALQFLNKSRDQFIFINFNQGFKQALSQYKNQKEGQVNLFIDKVKILFNSIKEKTLKSKAEMQLQYIQLKRLQSNIKKPDTQQIQVQTNKNFQEQFQVLIKNFQQLQRNYQALKQFKQNENQDEEKNLAAVQHKLVFKDREISLLKQQLTQKNHFIDFLNEKINLGIDNRTLRKISNLYKVHSKKNSSKLKIQLETLQKETGLSLQNLKSGIKNLAQLGPHQKYGNIQQDQYQNQASLDNKVDKTNINEQQNLQKLKKKRKAGFSFFANDKKFTSTLSRKGSYNFSSTIQNKEKQDVSDAIQQEDIMKLEDEVIDENQSVVNQKINSTEKIQEKKSMSNRNLVLKQKSKNKMDPRSSLQVSLKNSSKQFEPKLSSFGSKYTKNSNFKSSGNKQLRTSDAFTPQQQLQRQRSEQNSELSQFQDQEQINQYEFWNNIDQKDQQYLQSLSQLQNQFLPNRLSSEKQVNSIKVNNNQIKKPRIIKTSSMTLPQNQNKSLKSSVSGFKDNILQKQTNKNLQKFEQKNNRNLKSSQYSKELKDKKQTVSQQQSLIKKKNSQMNVKANKLTKNNKQQQSLNGKKIIGNFDDQPPSYKLKNNIQQKKNQEKEQLLENESNYQLQQKEQKKILKEKQENDFSEKRQFELSTYYTNLHRQQQQKSSAICSNVFQLRISPVIQTPIKENGDEFKETKQKKNNNEKQTKNKCKQLIIQQNNSLKNLHLRQISQKSSDEKNKNNKVEKKVSSQHYQEQIKQNTFNQKKQPQKILESQKTQSEIKTNCNQMLEKLSTYKEIQELKKQSNNSNKENNIKTTTSYDKIYGFYSTGRNIKETTLQGFSKQKMEEYLQNIAIKTALKTKNIEEFKLKMRKIHQSKCGNNCKHLQRYIQNFNKYKSSGRSAMKLHIENMHEKMNVDHLKQINVLPAINLGKNTF